MSIHPFATLPAALHELYASGQGDVSATAGAMLALAGRGETRPCLWARQGFLASEAGRPHPPGLREFGLDPARLILVQARDALSVLQAGLEGARCAGLGAVLIELWGESKAYDLTASRRLALAAKESGTPVFLARIAAEPKASAAETRWRVGAAPSEALAANAPGRPVFELTLLRARNGLQGQRYHLEWDRDARNFTIRSAPAETRIAKPALSGRVVSVSFDRTGGAPSFPVGFADEDVESRGARAG